MKDASRNKVAEHGRYLPLLASACLCIALASVWFGPDAGDDLVIVAMPWTDRSFATNAIVSSGGHVRSVGRWPYIMVARADRGKEAAFRRKLYQAGVAIIFSANGVSGCVTGE